MRCHDSPELGKSSNDLDESVALEGELRSYVLGDHVHGITSVRRLRYGIQDQATHCSGIPKSHFVRMNKFPEFLTPGTDQQEYFFISRKLEISETSYSLPVKRLN